MSIEIIDKLKQKNNGTFKLIDLEDVDYDGTGTSTKDKIEGLVDNQITLEEDDTSMEGIDDTEFPTLTTKDKKLIGAINEVNSQFKEIAKETKIKLSDFYIPKYKNIEGNFGFVGRWFEKKINGINHYCTINAGSEFYFKTKDTNNITINFTKITTEECYITYSIDGSEFTRIAIGNGNVNINFENSNEHIIRVIIDGISQTEDKWNNEVGVALRGISEADTIYAECEFSESALTNSDKYLFAMFDLGSITGLTGAEKFSFSCDICANAKYVPNILFFGNDNSELDSFSGGYVGEIKYGGETEANIVTHVELSNVGDYSKKYRYLRAGFQNSWTSYDTGTNLKMTLSNFSIKLGDIDITNKLMKCDILNASTMKKSCNYELKHNITGIYPQNKIGMFFGDSITEGIRVLGMSTQADGMSASKAFPFICCKNINAISYRVGFGGSGVISGGSGGIPPLNSVIDKITNTRYVDNFCPDFIVVNHGTNDAGTADDTFKSKYNEILDKLKIKYCGVPIFIIIPFNQFYSTQIRECTANRSYCYLIETAEWGITYTDGLHPNEVGAKTAGEKLADEILKILGKNYFLN